MKESLHSNNNYDVYVADANVLGDGAIYKQCYAVMNSQTGVVERYTPSLPEAIQAAEISDSLLESTKLNWRKDDCTH